MAKEYTYDVTCWVGYLNFLKQSLGRSLTANEIRETMQKYIHGVPVEKALEEIGK